jgi:RimJ/RimL family protein N-acetyltransferase
VGSGGIVREFEHEYEDACGVAYDARMADDIPLARELWTGERARLRGLRSEDAELFDRWNQEPDWSFTDGFAYPALPADHNRKFVDQELSRRHDPRDADDLRFIIEDATTGEAAGTIDAARADLHARKFRYGVAVSTPFRRRGLASEAILLVLRYYFQELDFQRVFTSVWSYNEPSRLLHERLGFVLEGTLRRSHFRAGRFHDELVFGMLIEEFEARHGEWARRTGAPEP